MSSSRAKRSLASCASASSRASDSAFRWRWSSSCSAVSTTDVTIPGLHTTPPARADGTLAHLRSDRADLERELRCARERVAPLVHRRRAGVRRLSRPGDLVALDSERAEHDAERQIDRLEHRPLLDVQLEIGGSVLELRARVERTIEIDAVLAQCVGQRDAVRVAALSQLVLVRHRSCSRRRAEERPAEARALLIRPIDEPHRHRRRAVRGDPPQNLSARHDVEAAVQPAAVRYRVDVPADEQRLLRCTRKREPLVAGLVDLLRRTRAFDLPSQPVARAVSHVSVHATRCAPFSSPVSSRSSTSSATVRFGFSAIARM